MTRRFTLLLVPMLVAVLTPAAPLGRATVVRIIQTNAAGDNAHVIDPTTNKVVGIIKDVEISAVVRTTSPSPTTAARSTWASPRRPARSMSSIP